MRVDLGKQLQFPREILETLFWPLRFLIRMSHGNFYQDFINNLSTFKMPLIVLFYPGCRPRLLVLKYEYFHPFLMLFEM